MYCHCMILIRKKKMWLRCSFTVKMWEKKKNKSVRCLNGADRLRQDVVFYQGSSIQRALHGVFKPIRNQTTTVSTEKTWPYMSPSSALWFV